MLVYLWTSTTPNYFTNALTLMAPCTHNFKQCKRYVTPFPGTSPDLNILNYCNCIMTHLISTQCLPKDCKERGVHTIAIKDIQMVPATFSSKFFQVQADCSIRCTSCIHQPTALNVSGIIPMTVMDDSRLLCQPSTTRKNKIK